MANNPKKPSINSNNTLLEYNSPKKSRQEINRENYQKNKEKRNIQAKVRYLKKKKQDQLTTKQIQAKYCQAEAIKILMSFKEYISLNKSTKKLWLDFNQTLRDIKEEIHDIVPIMKLRESADNLIKDYWETAKSKVKKGKSWNSLDYDEQQKLIKYWGYEKARIENGYLDEAERLERKSQEYLKEIDLAKFHEERGKIKCECYDCQAKQEIQAEVKAKIKKEMDDYDQQCPECKKWIKELDEESGVCKSCKKKYE